MTNKQWLIISVNSTLLFLLAYLVISVLIGFATLISASVFHYSAELFYSHIQFYVRSYDWTSDAVKVIFSTGPVLAFLLGFLLWILYTQVATETGILKLLVLWMLMQCIVFFFGDIMMGALFSQGFGYVIMYLYYMDTGKMLLTLVALIVIFTLGLLLGKQLLFTANTYMNMLPASMAGKFILFQYLIPFFTGNLIIALLKLPEIRLYELMLNLSLLVFLIPAYIRAGTVQDLFFDEDPKSIGIYKGFLLSVIIVLILYRVILGIGIPV